MSEKQERRRVKRIDCFDHSVLNANIEHSLVVDITNDGAGLLIEKDIVSSNVSLTIFHPDISLQDSASIEAKVIWVDHEYSSDRCKIGVSFFDLDEVQTEYVCKLENWLSSESNYYLHCELEKHLN